MTVVTGELKSPAPIASNRLKRLFPPNTSDTSVDVIYQRFGLCCFSASWMFCLNVETFSV